MSQTTATLISTVLQDLGALAAGATPASEDTAAVTTRLQPLVTGLANDRVIAIADINAIPDGVFPALVRLLAEVMAPTFGRPANEDVVKAARYELLTIDRRSAIVSTLVREVLDRLDAAGKLAPSIDGTTISARIPEVLADLATRGIASFVNEAAISAAARPPIALLLAETCVPGAFPAPDLAAAEAQLLAADRRSATASTLVREVLNRLDAAGKLSPTISSASITARIAEVLADLSARRVATFADEAAVTDAARGQVALLVAAVCAPGAVAPAEIQAAESQLGQASRLATASGLALQVLEQLDLWGSGSLAINATSVTSRLAGFLADLAVRNVIYIPDATSVPDEATPHVVRFIAAQLSPQPRMAERDDAERMLRRIARAGSTTPRQVFPVDVLFQRARRTR
jgi:hypothetical protein